MRFISLTVALTLTLASLVSASPVPIGDADIPTPVDKRTVVTSVPTVVPAPDPTDGGDLTPDFVKTKCQKQCVKAYPECVAANRIFFLRSD